jgi:hypothetical protein
MTNTSVANSITQLQEDRTEPISSSPYLMFKFSTFTVETRRTYNRKEWRDYCR